MACARLAPANHVCGTVFGTVRGTVCGTVFGTVWGIMNSFQAIALTQDTNLAVVAPGIAEALFATGLGLLAAIPAVIAYNKFTSDINRYVARLDYVADEFSIFLDRQSG